VRLHAFARPKDAGLSVVAAYDAIAADYDQQVSGDDWMRRALHRHHARLFSPGQWVLDVGCGTGLDSLALAQQGVRVTGVDGSAAMLEQLRSKASRAGLDHLVAAYVLPIESLHELAVGQGPFDGIVSSFASLSSLPDLQGFASDAATLVRPGGRVVLHQLNRFSLWEWLGYVVHRDFRSARALGRASRRRFTIGGQSIVHSLYFADEAYRLFFARWFLKHDCYGLGALVPPHTVTRVPRRAVQALEWLDLNLGRWRGLRDAGRFFVLDLERRPV
jgi:SAM-dependent methyltransferase